MAIGAIIGGASLAAGLAGSLFGGNKSRKAYKAAMAQMAQVGQLIDKQYADVDAYFKEAGTAFEGQYQDYYGSQIRESVNRLAGQGIYESPVSERALGRTRQALGETYATAKSQLAGQRLSAISAIDSQKISYLSNLAQMQYNRQLAKQQQSSQLFGTIGGIGASLLGA